MGKEIEKHLKEQLKIKEQPGRDKGWINTEDRISEILYGLIMALTYTCSISITKSDQTSVDDMLFGALSCNTAWGLIDAIMYLIMAKTDAVRANSILNFVRSSKKTDEACEYITDALPPVIASVLQPEEVEKIRERLSVLPAPASLKEQKWNAFKTAAGIFFLVFLSTFPVAIPFIFFNDMETALRISNLTAIGMMFFCGWALGKYAGRTPFFTGMGMSLFGAVLVLVTIALGG